LGKAPADKRFGAYWSQWVCSSLVGAIYIHFRSWDSIPHRPAPYGELFSWGTRHGCPMEIGRLWINKSINQSIKRSNY